MSIIGAFSNELLVTQSRKKLIINELELEVNGQLWISKSDGNSSLLTFE